MILAEQAPFALGDVHVDPATCTLKIAGEAHQVEPKVMQVLASLQRRENDVVSRSELHESCWPGQIVGDHSLHRAISVIRRMSKLSGPTGFGIHTIAKVGYRLEGFKKGCRDGSEITLAVLPFDCASTQGDETWLSAGIAEAVLTTLAAGTNIRVIGRSSSFQFTGANKAVAVVKAALRVTHVLDGFVQRDGDRIRIMLQLIEADGETVIWSDRIDDNSADLFDLGDRVAERVAKALDRAFALGRRPLRVDAHAYELYLRGAELTRHIHADSQARAVSLLTECVRLAPDLADAWGHLALARAQLGFFEKDPSESRAQANAEARKALEIDPSCASAKLFPYVGGSVFDFSEHRIYDSPVPTSHGRTSSPDVSYGVQMLEQGRVGEALEFFVQSERYDPLFQIRVFYHSLALLCDGSIQDGLTRLESAAVRWPELPFFLAARIRWAAAAGEWTDVDRLTEDEDHLRRSLGARETEIRAWIEFSRNPHPTLDDFRSLRKAAFADGRSGLEELLLFARTKGIEDILRTLDSSGEATVNIEATRRPDEIGPIALWLPIHMNVRRSAGFADLTRRILPDNHSLK